MTLLLLNAQSISMGSGWVTMSLSSAFLTFIWRGKGAEVLTIIVDLPIPPLSSPHLCVDCQLFWLWHRWSCYGILLEGSLILHNVFPHLLVIAFSLMFASSYTIISTLSHLCFKFMLHILWNLFTATHLYHYIWCEQLRNKIWLGQISYYITIIPDGFFNFNYFSLLFCALLHVFLIFSDKLKVLKVFFNMHNQSTMINT